MTEQTPQQRSAELRRKIEAKWAICHKCRGAGVYLAKTDKPYIWYTCRCCDGRGGCFVRTAPQQDAPQEVKRG